MSFEHGGRVARFAAVAKRDGACNPGAFYKSPTSGQTVDSLQPLVVSWDPSCIDNSLVDLYIYAAGDNTNKTVLQQYSNIKNSDGTYNVQLQPRFWGSTPSERLQVLVLEHNGDMFTNLLPAGPIFTATYAAPSSGPVPAAADLSNTNTADADVDASAALSSHKLSGGKVAAAVIIPLLVIILGALVWLKMSRKKQQAKRQAWNEKVDKRMSTLSQDWKPISVAGATAAVQNFYGPGQDPSRPSFGGVPNVDPSTFPDPLPAHIRPNFRQINHAFENRVSRVSFAADTRPSGETRRSRKLMSTYSTNESFHNPLPDPKLTRKDSTSSISSDGDLAAGTMSPRQTAGALSLSNDEIKRRISQRQSRASVRSGKTSFDEMLPALTLMRTMSNDNYEQGLPYPAATHAKSGEQYAAYNYQTAYSYASPVPPTPGAFASAPALFDAGDEMQSPTPTRDQFPKSAPAEHNGAFTSEPETIFSAGGSPVSAPNHGSQFGGMHAMQAIPASFMSPDDMLKAYATRQNSLSSGASTATTGSMGSVPPTYSPAAPSFKSTVLGKGVGVGGSGVGGISYPIPTLQTTSQVYAGRNLVPAGPGAVSPARGAYGVME